MRLVLAGASPEVVAAIIAAGASLVVSFLTAFFQKRNNAAVKRLEEARVEHDARVAYDYEARKRLYAVCEPLLFQGIEQAEDARSRISSLAKSASNGHLREDGGGWLDDPTRYYFKSIAYGLLAPITTFSVLQRRLTVIDLGLDPEVRAKYEMLRLIFFSFCQDWELARYSVGAGPLEYDRNKTDRGQPHRATLLRLAPQYYAPQGLYRAMVYLVAEALIPDSGDNGTAPADATGATSRCMTFGEFQRAWGQVASKHDSLRHRALDRLGMGPATHSAMTPIFDDVVELLQGFHPRRKPVLWRVLVTQYLLYRALAHGEPKHIPLTAEERAKLDWRASGDREDISETTTIAEAFVSEQLTALQARLDQ